MTVVGTFSFKIEKILFYVFNDKIEASVRRDCNSQLDAQWKSSETFFASNESVRSVPVSNMHVCFIFYDL